MPEFSMSKIASLDFDMIEDEDGKNLPFDMVIETKGMSNLNMKLDFKDNIIIQEDIELLMKLEGYFDTLEKLYMTFIEATELKEV